MSSLNYTTYIAQISNLITVPSSDPNFQVMAPGMIDYGENRIYRELDLLNTRVTDSTGALTANQRNFVLPTSVGSFLVVEEVNVITPSTATAATGTRVPLTNTARAYIDICYPSNTSGQTTPEFWSMIDDANIIVGPSPDAAYPVEVVGTQRPASLSASNSSTFLTQVLPDLFIAASMVFASGYQRDFSAQGDNPQQGQSWEGQYTKLMQSANIEELRKRYFSAGWTSMQPSPIATPARV